MLTFKQFIENEGNWMKKTARAIEKKETEGTNKKKATKSKGKTVTKKKKK